MRTRLLIVGVLALGGTLTSAEEPIPANLEPLPEAAPDLPGRVESGESLLEPEVRIIRQGETTVEEYRHNGSLYMIKVIPKFGKPYYLLDQDADGRMETNMSEIYEPYVVPQWVLFSW